MPIKQVLFKGDHSDGVQAGIYLENGFVICACCGGVFEPDEIEILHVFDYWVDFSEWIGDPDLTEKRDAFLACQF